MDSRVSRELRHRFCLLQRTIPSPHMLILFIRSPSRGKGIPGSMDQRAATGRIHPLRERESDLQNGSCLRKGPSLSEVRTGRAFCAFTSARFFDRIVHRGGRENAGADRGRKHPTSRGGNRTGGAGLRGFLPAGRSSLTKKNRNRPIPAAEISFRGFLRRQSAFTY